MYPSLPRWSEANSGAPSTAHWVSKTAVPSSHAPLTPATEGTSPETHLPAPGTRFTPSLAAQTKKGGRSGQLFVNHNVAPAAAASPPNPTQPVSSPSSSSAMLPPAGPSSSTQVPNRGGRAPGLSKHAARGGGGSGGGGVHYGHDAAAAAMGTVMHDALYDGRPSYATNRHGLMRGTTVANAVDAPRHSTQPLLLGVEGVQTGEGVVVDAAAARHRSLTGNGGATACPAPQDHAQVPQLKRQLEKANASVKSLTAANRRLKEEQESQKAEWELRLSEGGARLRAALAFGREREALLSHHVAGLLKRSATEAHQARQLQASAEEARAADGVRYAAELAALRRALDEANASAAAQSARDSTATAQQSDLRRLEAELDALHQSAAEIQHELETALAAAQSALNRANEKVQEGQQVQQQCNYLAQQCRLFIRQVCQPGFSVVKGPSLEAVEKDRPEPTGFVLVPLTVLLHGYTLLPEDDRQEVIDHYDKEAKALH